MIEVTLKGPITAGSDRDAVEVWSVDGQSSRVWFDGVGRVCQLMLEHARFDLTLTPGATSDPIIARLINEGGGDPDEWRGTALDAAALPQRRPRGRPSGMKWQTVALALSIFFEVERLRYRQVASPKKEVARNRDKSEERIRQLYHIGRRSIRGQVTSLF